MSSAKTQRTCTNGHKYYKSSDCPVCPICESKRVPDSEFLLKLSAPARRAIENAGIKNVQQLSKYSEADLKKLHGLGPSSIPKLKEALKQKGLKLKGD